jgi:hypothetical protein
MEATSAANRACSASSLRSYSELTSNRRCRCGLVAGTTASGAAVESMREEKEGSVPWVLNATYRTTTRQSASSSVRFHSPMLCSAAHVARDQPHRCGVLLSVLVTVG